MVDIMCIGFLQKVAIDSIMRNNRGHKFKLSSTQEDIDSRKGTKSFIFGPNHHH